MIIHAAQCDVCAIQYQFDDGNRYKLLPSHWLTVYTNPSTQNCCHFCGRHCLSEWLHKTDGLDSVTIEYTIDNKLFKGVVYAEREIGEKQESKISGRIKTTE
jgi:hypothetical protein